MASNGHGFTERERRILAACGINTESSGQSVRDKLAKIRKLAGIRSSDEVHRTEAAARLTQATVRRLGE